MKPMDRPLLAWYRQHKRDLPWRKTKDPYRILVSEFMLQQTQVQTVIPYYERWVKQYPTWQALARAPLGRVLKSWEGLGYYRRARNLHALAKAVMRAHAGLLPDSYEELIALPGIGRYTAGAVLSIAFDLQYPVLDGNVMRVLTRYGAIEKTITQPAVQKELWALAESIMPKRYSGDYNQALMELGATLCLPKNPLCALCPLGRTCEGRKKNLQYKLPMKTKRMETPHFHIGAGVIWHQGKILISQRPLQGLLGGLWEFPGGKQEKGEPIAETVRREIKEELGIRVRVDQKLLSIKHAYSHFKITLHVHECAYVSGRVRALGVKDWKWVKPEELKRFAFPAANHPIIQQLQKRS